MSLVKDMTYYSGMIMEGYVSDSGYVLCTGGRYDNLLGEFGQAEPSTGFAMGIERAMLALSGGNFNIPKKELVDYRFYFTPEYRQEVINLVQGLRAKGYWVQANILKENQDVPGVKGFSRSKNTIVCAAGQYMFVDKEKKKVVFKSIQELGDFICNI